VTRARMPPDLFADAGQQAASHPLTVFRADLISCADMVKLDLHALEQEMGFAVGRPAGRWRRR